MSDAVRPMGYLDARLFGGPTRFYTRPLRAADGELIGFETRIVRPHATWVRPQATWVRALATLAGVVACALVNDTTCHAMTNVVHLLEYAAAIIAP